MAVLPAGASTEYPRPTPGWRLLAVPATGGNDGLNLPKWPSPLTPGGRCRLGRVVALKTIAAHRTD